MNLFAAGRKIETVIEAAKKDEPAAKAWLKEAEVTVLPLGEKIIAHLIAQGVATAAEFAAAHSTLSKLEVLAKDIEPLLEDLVK